jgi:hypothetical protein
MLNTILAVIGCIVWVAIAIYDIYLHRHPEKETITAVYRRLFNRWFDYVIIIVVGIGFTYVFGAVGLFCYGQNGLNTVILIVWNVRTVEHLLILNHINVRDIPQLVNPVVR